MPEFKDWFVIMMNFCNLGEIVLQSYELMLSGMEGYLVGVSSSLIDFPLILSLERRMDDASDEEELWGLFTDVGVLSSSFLPIEQDFAVI